MWFGNLKLKLLGGAYLTVSQLIKHGRKIFFGVFFFFWNGKIEKKKSQSFFVCFHIPNVYQEHH